LKTEFKIERNLSFKDKAKMITALHPTPAVCGLPKLKALDLIKDVETHDREYYAGYWGPLEANGDFALYVNLRSMKIAENQLSLFVGGGIIADSLPQKEWEETQLKAQTLLSVIKASKLS
jgi:isochorismate synthase